MRATVRMLADGTVWSETVWRGQGLRAVHGGCVRCGQSVAVCRVAEGGLWRDAVWRDCFVDTTVTRATDTTDTRRLYDGHTTETRRSNTVSDYNVIQFPHLNIFYHLDIYSVYW